MLKFETQVVGSSNMPTPQGKLKFSAEVKGGVTVELPKNIKFTANVVQNNNTGGS